MNEKPVIIIGNGGHARVLVDILQHCKKKIIGFTSPVHESNPFQIPYLGRDKEILTYNPNAIELVNGIGSVSNTVHRKEIFEYFKSKNYSFATIVHSKAVIAESSVLGEGTQIMAGAIIQPFVKIADNTIINTSVNIDHDCIIGRHCHIAPGTIFSGNVEIGDSTHVGTGVTIIQNVKVGKEVLIGAGSLVLRNIDGNSKVFGVPAKEV